MEGLRLTDLNGQSLLVLGLALIVLILLSAFFASSETAMMTLNRYRLNHLASRGHRAAQAAQKLLERPDRLISLLLFGNNFLNILIAQIATVATLELWGEGALLASSAVLTAFVLVFAEVVPKTLAAIHPERVAFPAAFILRPLQFVLWPFVWALNGVSNGVLALLGVRELKRARESLSREELRTVVKEAGAMIPRQHQQMLFGILDLETATVEDIMVPRNDIYGINLDDEWPDVLEQLMNCRHTRVPCYAGNIDNIEGLLHLRRLAKTLRSGDDFTLADLRALLVEPYYVPMTTDLYVQLLNFQKRKQRIAFVVDEYGDLEGLVTLEDLLEEVIGEFTTDPQVYARDVYPQEDGSFLIDGTANIRAVNRVYGFGLPTNGPKTINGLILETLEDIPITGTTFRLDGITIEIVQTAERAVKTARLTLAASGLPRGLAGNGHSQEVLHDGDG